MSSISKKKYEDGHEYFTNPVRAIRQMCVECNDSENFSKKQNDCTAGQPGTVRCPIYPFRFGKNPFFKSRKLSEEEKQAAAKRLKKAREAKKENNNA